ncbi:hypothetical protein EVAR_91123_1 [Eumeta japonica]|uniref:Uncharacterized protein n=1 Tax=Eumeta variegata TaxID=151549 RepID=A0A4C1SG48_EUMVA|nr:hypothetical protein EVAR_91123_1 [Eumeta japonica]
MGKLLSYHTIVAQTACPLRRICCADHEFLSVQISRSGWDYPCGSTAQHGCNHTMAAGDLWSVPLVIYTSRMDKSNVTFIPKGGRSSHMEAL